MLRGFGYLRRGCVGGEDELLLLEAVSGFDLEVLLDGGGGEFFGGAVEEEDAALA